MQLSSNLKSSHKIAIILFAITFLTVSIYWQVIRFPFILFDDNTYVTSNPHVLSGLTIEGVRWAFTTFSSGNWHPLTWISHMLDVNMFGLDAGYHHLANLVFHLLCTSVLFLLMYRMTGDLWASALVATLFGVHPLHVESVVWIAERKDLLCTLFWFLGLWSYLKYVESKSLFLYFMVIISFLAGLLCKPMIVSFPILLVLIDYWPLQRLKWADKPDKIGKISQLIIFYEKIPLFLLSIIFSIITYIAQSAGSAVNTAEMVPFYARVFNAIISYGKYLLKVFYPISLSIFYPHPWDTSMSIPGWETAVSITILTFISYVFFRTARRSPFLIMGWLWYLIALLPTIGIVQVGGQAMADRYMYVPSIGIFIILAGTLKLAVTRYHRLNILIPTAVCIFIGANGLVAWRQAGMWQSSVVLFEQSLQQNPTSWLMHHNLAVAYGEEGKYAEAIRHYEEALRIWPGYLPSRFGLATILSKQGRTAEAIFHYEEVLKVNPDSAEAHNNLGMTLVDAGRVGEAIEHYRNALRLMPDHPMIKKNIEKALIQQNSHHP